ncbi:hypothetical protein [Nocardioides sp. S5]|uniref:hypothetical protein n=1 Tax=Nocardioides sp. S5 TaxID=2017486 RepID=UPI001A8D60AF|nr:hypothetical protein [Nocardioides sp. S5]
MSFVGVSGALGVLVVVFVVRDANSILETWSPARLLWCLLAAVAIIAIEPGIYAVSVAVGILIAIYLSASIKTGGLACAAWGGYLGAMAFALRNLSASVITVADQVDGDVALVSRRILPGLDPNAAAAILLVGIACGVYLAARNKGSLSVLITLGAGVMTLSIALMAARFAMLSAAISLVFLCLSIGNVSRRAGFVLLGVTGVSAGLPLVTEGGSLSRFADLSNDAGSRTSIYGTWWRLITDHGLLFGVPKEVIAAQPVAPHNAVLESLAHFGVVGTLMLALTATFLLLPFRGAGWQLRIPALAVLGLGMIVGLLAQYTVWIALVLLNAQRRAAVREDTRTGAEVTEQSRAPRYASQPFSRNS